MKDLRSRPYDTIFAQLAECADAELAELVPTAEKALAAFLEVDHVTVAASGLLALQAALHASGVAPGDEVICDTLFPFAIIATLSLGATPVSCDIDGNTLTIDPDCLAAALTERTKAVVATAAFGVLPQTQQLRSVLNTKPTIALIEDHAQAFGTRLVPGSVAPDAVCFSFQSGKLLSIGQGGALASRSAAFDQRARRYINLGWYPRSDSAGRIDWKSGWANRSIPATSGRLAPTAAGLLLYRLMRFARDYPAHAGAVREVEQALRDIFPELLLQRAGAGEPSARWRIAAVAPTSGLAEERIELLRARGSHAYHNNSPCAGAWPCFHHLGLKATPVADLVQSRMILFPVASHAEALRELAAVERKEKC